MRRIRLHICLLSHWQRLISIMHRGSLVVAQGAAGEERVQRRGDGLEPQHALQRHGQARVATACIGRRPVGRDAQVSPEQERVIVWRVGDS